MNFMNIRWRLALCLFLTSITAIVLAEGVRGAEDEREQELWRRLQTGNHFVMLRHAIAPGTGDPSDFTLGDCSTQRNLSEEGRRQAQAIGERLRRHNLGEVRVYSSQWCRCLETAELLDLGAVEELPALNSFFGRYHQKQERMAALRNWLTAGEMDSPIILVSHQVNITALTGVFPASGEMVVVEREDGGQFTAVGTIETDW